MTSTRFDVVGIGNAIVDVIAQADEAFLKDQGVQKGGMALINAEQAEALYAKMGPGIESSGGSAANTIAGVASLGGKAAYIGKVCNDQLGEVFAHDIKSLGVHFATTPLMQNGLPTARCLILVTPDAQRTMNTFLGACVALGPDDVDEKVIRDSKITYLEGYLWDPADAKDAFRKAMDIAHDAGREVAFTLSDGFCVDRHREEFLELVEGHVDILFANEPEIMSLYQTATFDEALQHVRGHCRVAALTRSEKGSVVLSGDEVHMVDAEPVAKVLDTTGAGDLYAAGFLTGLAAGKDLYTCGRMGGIAAAEVISHFGARPETSLSELVKKANL